MILQAVRIIAGGVDILTSIKFRKKRNQKKADQGNEYNSETVEKSVEDEELEQSKKEVAEADRQ